MSIDVKVKRLPHGADMPLPAYETAGAAGADLRAAVDEPLSIPPMGRALVPTGLSFEIPDGYEMQVRPRSGLAARHGITLLNTPGTVDSDYRGEVKVIMINLGDTAFEVRRGERIAQAIVAPVTRAVYRDVVDLGSTERGAGGFGSTGR